MDRRFERYPIREIEIPAAAAALYSRFVDTLEARLEAEVDRNLVCREALREIYTGRSRLAELEPGEQDDGDDRPATLLEAHFDPRNVTLEAERYHDADPERYARGKPLIWLWYLFDRSPLGLNLELGFRVRRLLARHLFKRCGRNFKCFPYVELAYGYNLDVGDDVVVHRWVNLDDRGGIVLGDRSSLADFANVYSHSHSINEQVLVENRNTIIEADCRVTYHATILSGSHMKRGSMLGAHALLTGKTVPSGEVWLGIPARKRLDKEYFIDPSTAQRWTVDELRERR